MARISMTAKKGDIVLQTERCTYALAEASLMDWLDAHLAESCASQEEFDAAWHEIEGKGLAAWLVANGFTFQVEPIA